MLHQVTVDRFEFIDLLINGHLPTSPRTPDPANFSAGLVLEDMRLRFEIVDRE